VRRKEHGRATAPLSRRERPASGASIRRRRTNVPTSMLTEMARLLRNTLDSIATPCSVKTETRLENLRFEDVTICDIPVISSRVGSNSWDSGRRSNQSAKGMKCNSLCRRPRLDDVRRLRALKARDVLTGRDSFRPLRALLDLFGRYQGVALVISSHAFNVKHKEPRCGRAGAGS
jgi:hypothetical protein